MEYERTNISPVERNDDLIDQQGIYTAAHVDKDNTSNIYSSAWRYSTFSPPPPLFL